MASSLAEKIQKLDPIEYAICIRKAGLTQEMRRRWEVGQIWLADSPYPDYNLRDERLFVIANVQLANLTCFEVVRTPPFENVRTIEIKSGTNLKKDGPFHIIVEREVMIKESGMHVYVTSLNNDDASNVAYYLRKLHEEYKKQAAK